MPALVQRSSNFWLACHFQLEPGDQLYSVKWYRNNEEFYRLLQGAPSFPGGAPQAPDGQQQYFAQLGVSVLVSWSPSRDWSSRPEVGSH